MLKVTLVGQVRTRSSIKIFHDEKENVYGGNGYGEGGIYPAQFVIKTIVEMQSQ